MLSRVEYSEYCKKYRMVYDYLKKCSASEKEVIESICEFRGYDESIMGDILREVGFVYTNIELCDYSKLKIKAFEELGLFSKEGNYLLDERFVVPVKDMMGNIIALIGWYPDEKKYITTPSKFFSKEGMFFGMEQLGVTGLNKDYFLVEGIFDTLSLRALGLNTIGMMGLSTSKYKVAMYSLFKNIVAVPDNDKQGRDVIERDLWKLPKNASYLAIRGTVNVRIEDEYEEGSYTEIEKTVKDADDLCKYFSDYDLKEVLPSYFKEKDRVNKLLV